MRSNTAIGIALGIVFGLFVDALLLLLINGWLGILIFPVLIPILIGIPLGIFLLRKLPPLSWWYLAGVIVLGVFFIQAPSAYVHWRLVALTDELPLYPGAQLTERLVIEGCTDNSTPWIRNTYAVDAPLDAVQAYMSQEFGRILNRDGSSRYAAVFHSPSGKQRVVVETSPSAFENTRLEVYMELYEFCGKW